MTVKPAAAKSPWVQLFPSSISRLNSIPPWLVNY